MYIEIEGIDGAGKTTQCELLRRRLEVNGVEAVVVKELESTSFGLSVRNILHSSDLADKPYAEMLLFLSVKAYTTRKLIEPALARGAWVIADRGRGSFITYHYNLFPNKGELWDLVDLALQSTHPDLTIVLDLPLEEARSRLAKKGKLTRFDVTETALASQKSCFLEIAAIREDWRVVDSTQVEENVLHDIVEVVDTYFLSKT